MSDTYPCPECSRPLRVWHELKAGLALADCVRTGCDLTETGEGDTVEQAVADLQQKHAAWVAAGKPRRL